MSYWRIALLGRLEATAGDLTVQRFGTQATAGLLAQLAYFSDHWHAREILLEALWPGVDPAKGRGRLNTAVHSLRRLCDGVLPEGVSLLESRHDQLRLTPGVATTDVAEFRARQISDPAAAVELWAGPLLPGVYLDWVANEREALTDELLAVTRRVVRGALARGEVAAAQATARRAVLADPLREEGHLLVIQAALAAGAVDVARQQYQQLTTTLRRELNLRPSFRFEDLLNGHGRPSPPALLEVGPQHGAAVRSGGTCTLLAAVGSSRLPVTEVVQASGGQLASAAAPGCNAAFGTARDAWRCAEELAAAGLAVALHTVDSAPSATLHELVTAVAKGLDPGLVVGSEATAVLLRELPGGGPAAAELGRYQLGTPPVSLTLVALGTGPGPAGRATVVRLPSAGRSSLPPLTSRFFGRTAELAHLSALLSSGERSLVSLTGPGGCGKSRLAVQLGRQWCETQGTPAWFVALAPLRETSEIAPRVIETILGEPAVGGDLTEALVFDLRRHPGLLILDNLEHLPGTALGLIAQLVERVPRLRCLVTSRQRLDLATEVEVPLEPLPVGAAGGSLAALAATPAVALFVDRARAASPTFALTPRNAAVVQQLCARLEGLPLALELAAARVATVTPAALLQSIGERLDWAAGRRAALPARQRTLRTTLRWSYDLLPAPLQRFLRRLSAFRGSFSAELAQEVTGEALATEYLASLRGYSLVVRLEQADEIRWRLLALVREFAADLLPPRDQDALAARHARVFARLAERSAEVAPADRPGSLTALGDHLDDLRTMLTWCLRHDPARGLRALVAAEQVWQRSGLWDEVAELLDQLLASAPAAHPQRGAALLVRGHLVAQIWPGDRAAAALDEAIAWWRAAGQPEGLVQALWSRTVVAGEAGDQAGAAAFANEGRTLAEQMPGLPARILALDFAAMPFTWSPEWRLSIPYVEAGLALAEELGDPQLCLIHAALLLGFVFYAADLGPMGDGLLQRYPPLAVASDQGMWPAHYRRNAAVYIGRRGDPVAAANLLTRFETRPARAGSQQSLYDALAFGLALSYLGAPAEALPWLLRAEAWWQSKQAVYMAGFGPSLLLTQQTIAACREALTPAEQRAAAERAATLTPADLAETTDRLPALAAAYRARQATAADRPAS